MSCKKNFTKFCKKYLRGERKKDKWVSVDRPWFQKYVDAYENNRLVIYPKFRQGGFTTMNLAYALWLCTYKKDLSIMFMCEMRAIDLNYMFQNLLVGFKKSKKKPVIERVNDHEIRFKNGCKVKFCTPLSACAQSYHILFIDEAAWVKDLENVWVAACSKLPKKGKIFMYSSPKSSNDWFAKVYTNAMAGENLFHAAPVTDCREVFSSEKLQEIKSNLGEKAFRMEFLQNFLPQHQHLEDVIEIVDL